MFGVQVREGICGAVRDLKSWSRTVSGAGRVMYGGGCGITSTRGVGVRDDGCGAPVSCLCGAGKGTGLSIQCSLSVASDGCREGNWNWALSTNWGKELRDLGRVEKRWSGGEFSKMKNVIVCAGV
ncbi:hypothetical protein DEO72_LG2g4965 [Vigna unguiculata]|uniref:Uncharacterized protein n=1 Tax=Vigna unguiculata TaxID=3917 RepID=A0A4D6L806_VIGUN|nr:hypothetical protein DEO72_LG2g4965 [Vigna unguiculata]